MEEIAAAAGISRATLFRRCPNRQVLVSAVARAAAEAYVAATDGVRLGLLAARDVERLVTETVLSPVRRPNTQR
ncbi:hypothetical protein ACI8AF_22955 [Blastococcus sp. SYSU D00669]